MAGSLRRALPGAGVMVGLAIALVIGVWFFWPHRPAMKQEPTGVSGSPAAPAPKYAGTGSCRECHEKFYQLWAPSRHGLALQPVTPQFLKTGLQPQKTALSIKDQRYQAVFADGRGWVQEQGPGGEKAYPLAQALGGKDVYYFLTPLDRGRLQILPVAYDVRRQEWFDTAASMIRHLSAAARGEPVSWRDPLLTFNTSCYSCHVSQLTSNYDFATDTYHTVWAEPGINCETCHGPAAEHVRVCREAPKGDVPQDLKIIRGGRDFTVEQNNATCAPCHAKMIPLTASFRPGERFFDHYDLITLENPDFYADGRDLGENFTETLWRLSPCARSGKLSCLHCHTSSGRYRFTGAAGANQACLPCHEARVNQAAAHINHPAGKPGTPQQCVACHLPTTEFARMRRTDHSMRPPAPAATAAYKSPNACNLCHRDKDAGWADRQVRKWRPRDYQAPVLYRAGLVAAARQRDWTRLPEMLKYLTGQEGDEVYAASLIRLLAACPDLRKWPVLSQALNAKSPLVRGAAAAALRAHLTPETRDALLARLDDDFRLVRLRAAAALAPYPRELLRAADQHRLDRGSQELLASLTVRPDDWTSHYNLGNFYFDRGELQKAVDSFAAATRLRPDAILPRVNVAMAQARLGQLARAEEALRQALKLDPRHAAANFNLALLLAEQDKPREAEAALRLALKTDPLFPEAAFNLGVLLSKDRLPEAIGWCRKALELQPEVPKYAYTLAFYLRQRGDLSGAMAVLDRQVQQQAADANIYSLLGELYENAARPEAAIVVYQQALADRFLSPGEKSRFETKLQALQR